MRLEIATVGAAPTRTMPVPDLSILQGLSILESLAPCLVRCRTGIGATLPLCCFFPPLGSARGEFSLPSSVHPPGAQNDTQRFRGLVHLASICRGSLSGERVAWDGGINFPGHPPPLKGSLVTPFFNPVRSRSSSFLPAAAITSSCRAARVFCRFVAGFPLSGPHAALPRLSPFRVRLACLRVEVVFCVAYGTTLHPPHLKGHPPPRTPRAVFRSLFLTPSFVVLCLWGWREHVSFSRVDFSPLTV